jgi:hypothetical protein
MALAAERGLWGLENDETLMRRFPPRPLVGMMRSAFWAPPEEYDELQRRESLQQRRRQLLDAEIKCHF